MWVTAGSAMGILAVGIGLVLGIGIALVFRGTRSLTARLVAAVLAVALGFVAARLIWPGDTTVHDWTEETALAPDWAGIREVVVGLHGGQVTLLPGQGGLWIEKSAVSKSKLEMIQVSLTQKGDALHLAGLNPAGEDFSAGLELLLEVPVQLERVEASGSAGSLALEGLSLPELVLRGLSLHATASQIGRLEVGPGSNSVRLEGGSVEMIEAATAGGPLFLVLKGIDPVPGGTLIRSSRRLLAELWLGHSYHLEVVIPTDGEVELPPLAEARWEELPDGSKLWLAGDEALPSIRLEFSTGSIRVVRPEG